MVNAWVVRPKPNGINRVEEFLDQGIVAIGWHEIGNLEGATKSDIRESLEAAHGDWSNRKVGMGVGQIDRFVNTFAEDDFVVVPDGGDVYIGRIASDYFWNDDAATGGTGHPNQRSVDWEFDGNPVSRSSLPGQLHDSLKGQLTVYSLDADRVEDLVESEVVVRSRDRSGDLQKRYLERLQEGDIPGINANSFEGTVVRMVLDNYFPSISRQATSSDADGDTDLMAELPGDVTVRVQVKHFYPERGELDTAAVEQLADSMSEGDNGIVVTSTDVSEEAERAADMAEHQIGIIDGEEFVELLFEDLQNYTEEELYELGLETLPPEIRTA